MKIYKIISTLMFLCFVSACSNTSAPKAAATPKILIIGDSISLAYTPVVKKALQNKALVSRARGNCQYSAHGVKKIDFWIGTTQWDVIHFNFGLWDLYGWKQNPRATPESFKKNLEFIVKRLKKTKAKIIFANTTPPCNTAERTIKEVCSPEKAQKFYNAAAQVMRENNVEINDLHSVVMKSPTKYQRAPNDVHYTHEGNKLLAQQVIKTLEKALKTRQASKE